MTTIIIIVILFIKKKTSLFRNRKNNKKEIIVIKNNIDHGLKNCLNIKNYPRVIIFEWNAISLLKENLDKSN